MKRSYYLGIDQGTSGVTAVIADENFRTVAHGYCELRCLYPNPGWVEHDAEEVWEAVCQATKEALSTMPEDIVIACVGVDHEGETALLWDAETGKTLGPAVVWQDQRTAEMAAELDRDCGPMLLEKTGLKADAYYSATKIRWMLDHCPDAEALIRAGRLKAGNLDSWIVWKMTGGKAHVTDASTASRTMLFHIHEGRWDQDILDRLGIDSRILPTICDSAMVYGHTDPSKFLGLNIPISGLMNDQQAALFGQGCIESGDVKTTYGTGCFMLYNTGDRAVIAQNGTIPTVALQINGKRTYALDGGIHISGASMRWLRDKMHLLDDISRASDIAIAAGTNGGVYFVPAFSGLSAPYWDPYARGTILGITGGTTPDQLIRAALEATAYQVADLLSAMEADAGQKIHTMRCDGGASKNEFMMQFQADLLGVPLSVPENKEMTALGSILAAAIGIGHLDRLEDVKHISRPGKIYEPQMSIDQRELLKKQWHSAVDRARDWAR